MKTKQIIAAAVGIGALTIGASTAEGQTCRVTGSVSLGDLPANRRFNGPAANGRAGQSVAFAANLDGDGVADIAIGAPQANSARGYTFVFRSVTGLALDTSPYTRYDGDAATGSSRAGFFLSSGDVVGTDGRTDLVIGAPYLTFGGLSSRGAAYVVDGASVNGGNVTLTAGPSIAQLLGEKASDLAGYSVVGAGDFDGDGWRDLLIGAHMNKNSDQENAAGAVYLIYGPAASTTLPALAVKIEGETANDLAGFSVAAADVNGDGLDDLLIGARNFDLPKTNGGAVYILYGDQTRLTGTVSLQAADVKLTGTNLSEGAGNFVTGVGDVDGDGFDDFAVGCVNTADSGKGRVYLVYGADGLASQSLANFPWFVGENGGDQLGAGYVNTTIVGAAIAGGDIDGDGFSDVLLGAPNRDGPVGIDAGAVYVLYGQSSPFPTGLNPLGAVPRAEGAAAGALAGFAIAANGDMNADGSTDVLIGAPAYNVNKGITFLYESFNAKKWYADTDGDGFGDPATEQLACSQPPDTVADNTDCNDNDEDVNPEAPEVCDGKDNDCNGLTDDGDPGVINQTTYYFDNDGDGYGDPMNPALFCFAPGLPWVPDGTDCDDFDATIHPGASEICDYIDNDCDPWVDDEDPDVTGQDMYYFDNDGDGYGDPINPALHCFAPGAPYVADGTDCDDFDATIHPGAPEICDYIDNNCNTLADDDDPAVQGQQSFYADLDGDTFGNPATELLACFSPGVPYVLVAGDCNDAAPGVNPAAQEVCDSNNTDENCNALADDTDPNAVGQLPWYHDVDADGFGNSADSVILCDPPDPSWILDPTDCDDTRADVNPAAQEVCDASHVDEDCDTLADDGDPSALGQVTWHPDGDGDGFGDPNTAQAACDPPIPGAVLDDTDCDDGNAAIHPSAQEICNGVDDDCDALADDADPNTALLVWYGDGDGDGFGDPTDSLSICVPPDGYVGNDGDCNDDNAKVNPDSPEVCNSIDDDCDGTTDTGDTVWFADADQDGWGSDALFQPVHAACDAQPAGYINTWGDCKDLNPAIHPEAVELCDGVDQDCDGAIDDDAGPLWYPDADGDNHGVPGLTVQACTQPPGHALTDDDCNDGDASVHPGAPESCNGTDDNCNSQIDEGASITFYADTDGDGAGNCGVTQSACSAPAGYVPTCGDCNDSDADLHPGAPEYCNGTDDNCDGQTDESSALDATTWFIDKDSDSFGSSAPPFASIKSCTQPAGYVSNDDDCDDLEPEINPNTFWYADQDADGHGGTTSVQSCEQPAGHTASNDDCNDQDNTVLPGAPELCDGKDNDCDFPTQIDESPAVGALPWYPDADGDGHGKLGPITEACNQPPNTAPVGDDCNDANPNAFPGATETCDGADNDCDGQTDESVTSTFCADFDGDGFGNPNPSFHQQACSQPQGYVTAPNCTDCNDGLATAHPNAPEICDGADNDCDSQTDEGVGTTWYADADGDGYGNASVTTTACNQPAGYAPTSNDCDDTDMLTHPYSVPFELCDDKDNDCNGIADDNYAFDAIAWYPDADGDEHGATGPVIEACEQPPGYAPLGDDCNDTNASAFPGGVESCDGADNDCNGETDEDVGSSYYADFDGDGFGNPNEAFMVQACAAPPGYVADNTDCNDGLDSAHPGAPEICDGFDNDCDGVIENGIALEWWYGDLDNDGYGTTAFQLQSCSDPNTRDDVVGTYVLNDDDCNDIASNVHPGGQEVCNGHDDNCDGTVDEDLPIRTWYLDLDHDGCGNPNVTQDWCAKPGCLDWSLTPGAGCT